MGIYRWIFHDKFHKPSSIICIFFHRIRKKPWSKITELDDGNILTGKPFFFGKNHGLRCSDFPQQTNDQNMVHLRKVLRGWRPVASASYASRATWPSARRPCRRRPGAWRCRPSNRWRRSSRWISFRGQSLGPWEMWCFWWGFYGFFKGVLMGFNSSGNFTWLWKMAYIHSWFTY